MKKIWLSFLLFVVSPNSLFASEGGASHGGGNIGGYGLLPFKDVTDIEILSSRDQVVETLRRIDFTKIPQIQTLADEVQFSKLVEMSEDVHKRGNQFLGDWRLDGKLYGYTDLAPGAPTMIYPIAKTALSREQMEQLFIHEGLHRALPFPLNSDEDGITRLTQIISLYSPVDKLVSEVERTLQQMSRKSLRLNVKVTEIVGVKVSRLEINSSHPWKKLDQTINFPWEGLSAGFSGKELGLEGGHRVVLESNDNSSSFSRFTISLDVSSIPVNRYLYDISNPVTSAYGWYYYTLYFSQGALLSGGNIQVKITDQAIGVTTTFSEPLEFTEILDEIERKTWITEVFLGENEPRRRVTEKIENIKDRNLITQGQAKQLKVIREAIEKILDLRVKPFFESKVFDRPEYKTDY